MTTTEFYFEVCNRQTQLAILAIEQFAQGIKNFCDRQIKAEWDEWLEEWSGADADIDAERYFFQRSMEL
jgi:hypothetical protein